MLNLIKYMKKRRGELNEFSLVKETSGKICSGVYIKKDKSEVIIRFAWGKYLHFKKLNNNEISL